MRIIEVPQNENEELILALRNTPVPEREGYYFDSTVSYDDETKEYSIPVMREKRDESV